LRRQREIERECHGKDFANQAEGKHQRTLRREVFDQSVAFPHSGPEPVQRRVRRQKYECHGDHHERRFSVCHWHGQTGDRVEQRDHRNTRRERTIELHHR
jgi:hypothetical protein